MSINEFYQYDTMVNPIDMLAPDEPNDLFDDPLYQGQVKMNSDSGSYNSIKLHYIVVMGETIMKSFNELEQAEKEAFGLSNDPNNKDQLIYIYSLTKVYQLVPQVKIKSFF